MGRTASSSWGPVAVQVYVQAAFAAMFLVTRVALVHGMSHYYYVMYRQIAAAITVCPLALFLHRCRRGQGQLNLTLRNWFQIFVLALLGVTAAQNSYAGLAYTSTILTSTLSNLNPAITFVMAYFLRLEELDVRSRRGQAKVLGTLLCVGGAMVMTFVRGGPPSSTSTLVNYDDVIQVQQGHGGGLTAALLRALAPDAASGRWILGVSLVAIGAWMWSAFLVYQAQVAGEYPSQLSLSALVCFVGAVQSTAVSCVLESPAALRVDWDFNLFVITYSGVFCSGLGLFATMWCVKEKGPVFTSAFNPLSTVLVAVLEPLLLHVQLHWGTVIGMVMIIGGLYCVIWGKDREGKAADLEKQQDDEETSERVTRAHIKTERDDQEPLLASTEDLQTYATQSNATRVSTVLR